MLTVRFTTQCSSLEVFRVVCLNCPVSFIPNIASELQMHDVELLQSLALSFYRRQVEHRTLLGRLPHEGE